MIIKYLLATQTFLVPEKHLGANVAYLFEVQNGAFMQIDNKEYTY